MCPSIFSFLCTSSEETAPPHPDHDYAELPLPLEEQLQAAHKTINDQAELIAQLQDKQFLLSRFQGDNKNIMFFTGFPDYNTLKAVFTALQPTAENMVGWRQAQQLRQADEEILKQGFSIPKLTIVDQFFPFSLSSQARFSWTGPCSAVRCVTVNCQQGLCNLDKLNTFHVRITSYLAFERNCERVYASLFPKHFPAYQSYIGLYGNTCAETQLKSSQL